MRAMALRRYGGPEVLEEMDLPEPRVGPDSVLIRARAAGVNPVDYKVREGRLDERIPSHFPLVPGWDVAGVIERVGPAVRGWAPGDEVMAYNRQDHLQWGTYAELVSAPTRTLARKPASVDWEAAAALPLAGLTAYQALTEGLELAPGETVLVHAAAGGVGSMAVQIARILGAEATGTASPANHDYLRSLWTHPVAYGDGLAERVRALHPAGVDAVLDLVGGETLQGSLELLRLPHRVASIVDPAGVASSAGATCSSPPTPSSSPSSPPGSTKAAWRWRSPPASPSPRPPRPSACRPRATSGERSSSPSNRRARVGDWAGGGGRPWRSGARRGRPRRR
ncbi:MAG: hypothetical protein QOF77_764 [Solirubrobacteraceae bacterium]|nr:hypothetical protein [Solirubrobacteraceae bacterium]